MAQPIKRLHYFDHQFLREDDFTDEQEYHMGMTRLHNRLLHTWGIADGLEVEFETGASAVTVRSGTAGDSQGRQIVLTEDELLELSGFPANTELHVTIAYDEQQTEPTEETGVEGNTRWTEKPLIEASDSGPTDPGQKLVLARVSRSGTEVTSVDGSERRAAGVVGGDLEVRTLTLTDPDVVSTQWPRMHLGEAKRADVEGNLRVNGDLNVEGTIRGDIAVGAVRAEDLIDDAVTSPKIAEADGITGQNTSEGRGVKTDHLQDGAVSAAKLAPNSVDASKIVNGTVGAAELANNAVTNAKIADNAVNAAKIQDGSVGAAELANYSVTNVKLANDSVNASKIVDGSIGTAELASNAVSLDKIRHRTWSGTSTVNKNSETVLQFLTNKVRFVLINIIPDTNKASLEWTWGAYRDDQGKMWNGVRVRNLTSIIVQFRYTWYEIY